MEANWRQPTEDEIIEMTKRKRAGLSSNKKLVSWTIIYLIYFIFVLIMYLLANSIRDYLLKLIMILIVVGFVIIMISIQHIREYNDYKRIKSGKFLVCNAKVIDKHAVFVPRGRRTLAHYEYSYKILLSGYSKQDDDGIIEHKTNSAMYTIIQIGDRILVLRYDVNYDNRPFRAYEFHELREKSV